MPKNAGPFFTNTYPISQYFGGNYNRYAQFGLVGHDGIDIVTPLNTTVLAGVNGVVLGTGNDPTGYGLYVRVFDGAQNLLIIYAHLLSIAPLIQPGYKCVPQNPIGGTGNTGNSTGPHCHLGFADTDSAGSKINRENGYDGWKNPEDTNFLILKLFASSEAGSTTVPSPTATPGTTTPAYTGPPPPPYAPTFAGQSVSTGGNFFQSDNGTTWIFKGSDADRAAAEAAEKKRTAAEFEAQNPDAGVYLRKNDQSERYTDEGTFSTGAIVAGPEFIVIKGPYEGKTGKVATVSLLPWHTTPGSYPITESAERVMVRKKPLPPAPAPLPNIPVPEATSTTPSPTTPAPPAGTPPASTSPGTEPWAGVKAPTHKNIYNKLVEMFAFLKT